MGCTGIGGGNPGRRRWGTDPALGGGGVDAAPKRAKHCQQLVASVLFAAPQAAHARLSSVCITHLLGCDEPIVPAHCSKEVSARFGSP
jgi:hypothetical protein